MKNVFQKIFCSKKTSIPFFATIALLEVLVVIFCLLGEQHWIIFGNALAILGLIVAIFLTNHFKKYKATRVLTTIVFFIEAVIITAYSFMPFPKAPSANANYVTFVIYLIYACTFFSSFLCAIILHVNLNKKTNANTLFAMYIICMIMLIISLGLIIGYFINFARAGYTHMLLCDLLTAISFDLIGVYLLTNETQMLPEFEKKLK